MSKAILVLEEMPYGCICCPCRDQYSDGSEFCQAKGEHLQVPHNLIRKRPNWCPLREVPEKQVRDYPEYDRYITGYDDGWDDCLDEILGE